MEKDTAICIQLLAGAINLPFVAINLEAGNIPMICLSLGVAVFCFSAAIFTAINK